MFGAKFFERGKYKKGLEMIYGMEKLGNKKSDTCVPL
jgi:hypothetical protein